MRHDCVSVAEFAALLITSVGGTAQAFHFFDSLVVLKDGFLSVSRLRIGALNAYQAHEKTEPVRKARES